MASGTDIAAALPAGKTAAERAARERMVLDLVKGGNASAPDWTEVVSTDGGNTATMLVNRRPLNLAGTPKDPFYVSTTARTANDVAAHFDAYLLTPRIADLMWRAAAKRLTPCTQTSWADGTMEHTRRMLEHSRCVEQKAGAECGLVSDAGKNWVITKKVLATPGLAANYGWHVPTGHLPAADDWAGRVIQSVGHAHNDQHVDYSQTLRFVHRTVSINGVDMDLADAVKDARYAALFSHQGVLGGMRPGDASAPAPDTADTDRPLPPPSEWRTLKRGIDDGPDVAAWQHQLLRDGYNLGPWGADGDFGGQTHNATMSWQKARGLVGDGIVGSRTRAAIGREPIARPRIDDQLESQIPYVEAKNYTRGYRRPSVDLIVIHTMEAVEASTTAEAVAAWFAGASAPRASAHLCIDDDSIVRCVPDEYIAWHAPGANGRGIGIEHAGYARQNAEQWADEFSRHMLQRSSGISARIARRWGIPLEYVPYTELDDKSRGVTTHWDVSRAFKKSDHWDPGKEFPMDHYLEMARAA